MQSPNSMCGESRKDRCRYSDFRKRCGLKEDVATRVERGMLRWSGHLERMNESRLTKQIYRVNVCNGKCEPMGALPRRRNRARVRRSDGAVTGEYHRDERKRDVTVAAQCILRGITHTHSCANPDTPERGSKEH
ncbi:hypothetical protein EVAR_84375_1 [Eumeta japonica]|uniref:Uncharacterized protein n=1 Tax=Eumeta variegata TaxID=151549 RepID=A0A4C1U4R3_EUMVA|nr:hypothetical protein EVAR_84375_1 [Eumeta japonica]